MLRSALLSAALAFALPFAAAAAPDRIPLEADERSRGFSGKLQAAFVDHGEVLPHRLQLPDGSQEALSYRWLPTEGTQGAATALVRYQDGFVAPKATGVFRLEVKDGATSRETDLVAVVREPATSVRRGKLNGYRIGTYPSAGRMGSQYAPPESYIEVTEENQDLAISPNFQLRHFLTKNQQDVWPKYLVLDLQLVDKLEAVTNKLQAMGFEGARLHVMSGYRTPQYNGPGRNGRARFSRHTYGDASDVWVDADGDGYMDDLNGDGKRNTKDADFLAQVVTEVEADLPELTGGAGIYKANRVHGPFLHIDARGRAARWSSR